MNNPYFVHKRSENLTKPVHTFFKKQSQQNRNATTICHPGSALDQDFLMARRQNYLNTGYNNRRKRLQTITTENKKIYVKINSQKSQYSREELRKSYESNASISRRLSQSKISQRQSSRASIRSSRVSKNKNNKYEKQKPKQQYSFQPQSVAHIKINELKKFTQIFKTQRENNNQNQCNIVNEIGKKQRRYFSSSKSTPNEIKIKLPLLPTHGKTRKIQPLQASKGKNYDEGSFLHIIAQEMFGGRKRQRQHNPAI